MYCMQRKLPRSSMRAWTISTLKTKQGGLCAVCLKPIDVTKMGRDSDYVVDHCHETGVIRGVLHRSCNAALGKIDNAAGRWGAKSMLYSDILPYLKKVVAYYDTCNANPSNLIYPDHKTDEQKAEAKRAKARKASALSRAKAKLKANKELNESN